MTFTIMHKISGMLLAGASVPTTLNLVSTNVKVDGKKQEATEKIDIYSESFKTEFEMLKKFFKDFQKEANLWSQPLESFKKASQPLIWLSNPKNLASMLNNNWGDQIISAWKEQTGVFKNLQGGGLSWNGWSW